MLFAICVGCEFSEGAVVLNQIGDVNTYDLEAAPGPSPSQIFTDFIGYDSMVLEDFTALSSELTITQVSALFRAQGGFAAFEEVQGYSLNVFSSVALAATSLTGDVASQMVTVGFGASVDEVVGGGGEYGLVSLTVNIPLPLASIYWIGISPVSAQSVTGQFLLQNSGATGVPAGNANAKLANPGEQLGLGALSSMNLDYAYAVTAVPEPQVAGLPVLAVLGWMLRRRRISTLSRKS